MAKGGKRGRAVKGGQAAEVVKGSSGGGQGGQAQVGGQASGYHQGPAYCGLAWPNKFLMFSDPVPHQVTMQLQQFQAVTVWDRLFRMRKKNFLSTGPETSRKRSVCSRASKRTIERVFECHTKYLNTYFDIHMRYSNIFYKII